ncbi:UDP binding domain-containing protein [Streptomyces sp. NBC_01716]|uniref:UDP binding domain-containing protein n=1 Tax=Streptomyces sp. NBC_01716 TaxID=2975917 RepID=UPI002E319623|nr:UDP binding domain-containing protein [Streptomyces sp. NBC_01716]
MLGVTYKADIADQREPSDRDLVKHLCSLGVEISDHDPYMTDWWRPNCQKPFPGPI